MAGREGPTVDAKTTTEEETAADRPPGVGSTATLLDGAGASGAVSLEAYEEQRHRAADPARPLAERLEAFEDIMDSEVGDTGFNRVRNVERACGLRQLYLKFDGGNPTGTQKDRIAFAQVEDAMRRGFDAITVATCGNYGTALAMAASLGGLRCLIHVPAAFHTKRQAEMEALGAVIERVPGDYETAVRVSREVAEEREIYDANPGGANTALQLQAYGQIAYEIYDELRDAPAVVAVPVSNGTTLAGIYHGFVRLHRRGKTSRIPQMVAGSSAGKNPIVRSFLKGLPECQDLDPAKVRETEVNEPLINWHSFDGDQALAALRESGGWAHDASDREMRRHARLLLEQEGLNALPASTAGLLALLERQRREPLPADRYVAVLTGRR